MSFKNTHFPHISVFWITLDKVLRLAIPHINLMVLAVDVNTLHDAVGAIAALMPPVNGC